MEVLNHISKIYFYEFLYRNNPLTAFTLLKLDRNSKDYFYTAASRYRTSGSPSELKEVAEITNQATISAKFHFIQQLVHFMQRSNWNNLDSVGARNILAQAAKYDLLYPFTKINPEKVTDNVQRFLTAEGVPVRVILQDIDVDDPGMTFESKPGTGYLFEEGALLNIATFYNSQQVAKFLMQNNNYTIDVHEQVRDYTYRPKFINTATYTEFIDEPDSVYHKVDIASPLTQYDELEQPVALDIAIYQGDLDMVKILTEGRNLERWWGRPLLIAIQFNRVDVIDYLLQHQAQIVDDDLSWRSGIIYAIENNVQLAEYIINYIIKHNISYYLNDTEVNEYILEDVDNKIMIRSFQNRVNASVKRHEPDYKNSFNTRSEYLQALQRIKNKIETHFST